jgi:nucleotide-binding universal stress UspA family protein
MAPQLSPSIHVLSRGNWNIRESKANVYETILIPLENSVADQAILRHIRSLAKMTRASLILIHVADGWVARNYDLLNLADSEEMKRDRLYLKSVAESLRMEGFEVSDVLRMGEPSDEIVRFTCTHKVDLIAMSTHGHGFIGDLLYGSTADKVRHLVEVPVLMLKSKHNATSNLSDVNTECG